MNLNTDWTSLAITKLIVAGLTPVLIAIIGLLISKKLKKLEHNQWRNQKLIEKRLLVYDELAPLLNDILCYYSYVGNWKEHTPIQIIALKRIVDKKIYLVAPMFCKEFFSACMTFMNLCYGTYKDWGEDAKLKTNFERRKQAMGANWDLKWDKIFCVDECSDFNNIRTAYLQIMNIFSEEIGLQNNNLEVTGRIPANIK
jgi:hypothetical protein